MLIPFAKILEKYRSEAFSESDKGARFEELMRAYLWSDPKVHSFPLRNSFLCRFLFCLFLCFLRRQPFRLELRL